MISAFQRPASSSMCILFHLLHLGLCGYLLLQPCSARHTITHIRWLLQVFGRDTGEQHNGTDALLRTEDRLNKSKQICFSLIASDRQAVALHLKTQVAPPWCISVHTARVGR